MAAFVAFESAIELKKAQKANRVTVGRTSPEEFRKLFEQSAGDPEDWLALAEGLKLAAEILLPAFDKQFDEVRKKGTPYGIIMKGVGAVGVYSLPQVYLLLAGYAIEDLLKGILIAQDPSRVKDGKLLGWGGKEHDLIGLCELADIEMNDATAELFKRLSVFIQWGGRYPTPKISEKMPPRPLYEGGHGPMLYWLSSDPKVFTDVFGQLSGILRRAKSRSRKTT